MDELHHSRKVMALRISAAQRARHQQKQGRAQPFASRRDDVVRDLTYQGHAGIQSVGDQFVDLRHVLSDQLKGVGGGVGGGQGKKLARVEVLEL